MFNRKDSLSQTKTVQRFSIRKLTVGAASVLLGFFFFSANGNQVQAAENTTESAQAALVQTQDNKETTSTDSTAKTEETAKAVDTSTETAKAQTSTDESSKAETQTAEPSAQADSTQTTTKDVTTKPASSNHKDDALIPGANNTEQPEKVNGEGQNSKITNVPSDGSITYDYSISAKNNKTGQTEEIHSAASGKDNSATINTNNSSDIEAHLTLSNKSDQAKVIGDTERNRITPDNYDKTRHPDEQATLFINAWTGSTNHSIKIDGSKAATIVVTKDGQIIANDPDSDTGLEVDYLAADGKWYKYNDFVQKFGQSAINSVTQIGFRGVLPGEATATMNVPLIYDKNATITQNAITTKALNDKSINVNTELNPIWSKNDDSVKTAPIDLTYRDGVGRYTRIPDSAEIWQEIADSLSKEGQDTSSLLNITNSGAGFDTTGDNLYSGGTFQILLPEIQKVLQKHGYSVNPSNGNYKSLMPYYTYSTNGGLIVYEDAQNGGGEIKYPTNHPYFYIEVHKIVETKPATFVEKSTEAQNFNVKDVVSGLFDVGNRTPSATGDAYGNIAVDTGNAEIISIKNAAGETVSKIDGTTPAGTYIVTVGYKLNGSNDPAMLITKTAEVTITPVTPVQPTDPVQPSQPTTPTTPVTPVQPTAPVTPSTPVQPTAPVQPSNVRPLPEKEDKNTTKDTTKKTNTQKGNQGGKKVTTSKTITPKANVVNTGKNLAPKNTVLNNRNGESTKAASTSVQNAVSVKKDVKTLPQTGEKKDSLGFLGLAIAAAAGLFGMSTSRKKKN